MKVLFIGLGSIAKKHIHVLRELYSCEIYALRSVKNAKPNTGVVNVDDITEIISEIDFVFLTNPTHLHSKYLDILVEYGKPIFLEKPPSHSLEGIDDLSLKIKESGIITYVGCNLRFHPSIVFLKDNLPGKKINEIDIYSGSYLPDWRDNKDYKNIYSARKDMGGGVHLDLFHEIDYASWLFGFPSESKSYTSSKSTLNITAIDYANYVWSYEDFNVSIILNYYRRSPRRIIEILFEDETWTIDLIKSEIKSDLNGVIFSSDLKVLETYKLQIQYFVNCLNANIVPMNSFEESIINLKLCLKTDYEIKE
jgi:predicted dehydrogenase